MWMNLNFAKGSGVLQGISDSMQLFGRRRSERAADSQSRKNPGPEMWRSASFDKIVTHQDRINAHFRKIKYHGKVEEDVFSEVRRS